MKINEVEKQLDITRANVRFYEKQGLLNPSRSENSYREYSQDDVQRLKQIILLRKCNISIESIKSIFCEEKSLSETAKEQIDIIDSMISELNGAKKVCQYIVKENAEIESLDEDRYLDMIKNEEKSGSRFHNIANDFFGAEENLVDEICKNYKGEKKMKIWTRILVYFIGAAVFFGVYILMDLFLSDSVDWLGAAIAAVVFMIIDIIGNIVVNRKKA